MTRERAQPSLRAIATNVMPTASAMRTASAVGVDKARESGDTSDYALAQELTNGHSLKKYNGNLK
jgi:hypothetical protein